MGFVEQAMGGEGIGEPLEVLDAGADTTGRPASTSLRRGFPVVRLRPPHVADGISLLVGLEVTDDPGRLEDVLRAYSR